MPSTLVRGVRATGTRSKKGCEDVCVRARVCVKECGIVHVYHVPSGKGGRCLRCHYYNNRAESDGAFQKNWCAATYGSVAACIGAREFHIDLALCVVNCAAGRKKQDTHESRGGAIGSVCAHAYHASQSGSARP